MHAGLVLFSKYSNKIQRTAGWKIPGSRTSVSPSPWLRKQVLSWRWKLFCCITQSYLFSQLLLSFAIWVAWFTSSKLSISSKVSFISFVWMHSSWWVQHSFLLSCQHCPFLDKTWKNFPAPFSSSDFQSQSWQVQWLFKWYPSSGMLNPNSFVKVWKLKIDNL